MRGLHKQKQPTHIDKRQIEQKGVILPIQRLPLRFLPGRHVLGRAGDGMRFLRNRPYEPLEDNPRDIDKFSPIHSLTVNECEHEAQADILVLADVSASMSYPQKSILRNTVILQLIYSLWRAGDRVRVALFAHDVIQEIREANLRSEMEQFQHAISDLPLYPSTNLKKVLESCQSQYDTGTVSQVLVVSDFISSETLDNSSEIPANIVRRLHGNLVPIIITFNLDENPQGLVKVWDPETNRQGVVMLSRSRLVQINEAERVRVGNLHKYMRSANLDSVAIGEQRQIFPSLLNLSRIRERRRH